MAGGDEPQTTAPVRRRQNTRVAKKAAAGRALKAIIRKYEKELPGILAVAAAFTAAIVAIYYAS